MSDQGKLPGSSLPPILPVGTTIVLTVQIPIVGRAGMRPKGSPAVIVQSPVDPHHHIPDLIARKIHGAEKSVLSASDLALHEAQTMRLLAMLEEAGARSTLPDLPTTMEAMNDLLVRVRMNLKG